MSWFRIAEARARRRECSSGSRVRCRKRCEVRERGRRSGMSRYVRICRRSSGGRWGREGGAGCGGIVVVDWVGFDMVIGWDVMAFRWAWCWCVCGVELACERERERELGCKEEG
jgi:hypothetical protein